MFKKLLVVVCMCASLIFAPTIQAKDIQFPITAEEETVLINVLENDGTPLAGAVLSLLMFEREVHTVTLLLKRKLTPSNIDTVASVTKQQELLQTQWNIVLAKYHYGILDSFNFEIFTNDYREVYGEYITLINRMIFASEQSEEQWNRFHKLETAMFHLIREIEYAYLIWRANR